MLTALRRSWRLSVNSRATPTAFWTGRFRSTRSGLAGTYSGPLGGRFVNVSLTRSRWSNPDFINDQHRLCEQNLIFLHRGSAQIHGFGTYLDVESRLFFSLGPLLRFSGVQREVLSCRRN